MRVPQSDVAKLRGEAPPNSKGQIRVPRQWYPAAPIVYSASAGSALATSLALDPTVLITNWATRFKVFQEYRILGIKVHRTSAIVSGVATSAIVKTWFDEGSSAAPTFTASAEQVAASTLYLSANQASKSTDRWVPTDTVDLGFVPTGTGYTPVYAKQYTDNNWGNVTASQQLLVLVPEFLLEFRGLATV